MLYTVPVQVRMGKNFHSWIGLLNPSVMFGLHAIFVSSFAGGRSPLRSGHRPSQGCGSGLKMASNILFQMATMREVYLQSRSSPHRQHLSSRLRPATIRSLHAGHHGHPSSPLPLPAFSSRRRSALLHSYFLDLQILEFHFK